MDMRHTPEPVPLLRGREATLWVAAAQIALMFAGSTLLTPLYRLYQDDFGFSQLTLTLIYSAYVLGNLLAVLLLGRLSDQIGRRVVNLIAIGVAVLATLLFGVATSTAWLFAGRVVSGMAIALAASAATAWLAELTPDRRRASVFATAGNFFGLAFGALLAGLLASYLPSPLRRCYAVYLALLLVMSVLVAQLPETVKHRVRSWRRLSLHPRLGVPRELLGAFIPPAAICFATFAVFGFYAALMPSVMAKSLSLRSPAVGGAVVALLTALGAVTGILTQKLSSRTAMLAGAALMAPAVVLLPLAEALHSLALLLAGTVAAGAATILAYRGSLQVVTEMAPDERRGEVIATYTLCCYAGNSLPIIGVGLLSDVTGGFAADVTFAAVVVALALLALVLGSRWLPRAAH